MIDARNAQLARERIPDGLWHSFLVDDPQEGGEE